MNTPVEEKYTGEVSMEFENISFDTASFDSDFI